MERTMTNLWEYRRIDTQEPFIPERSNVMMRAPRFREPPTAELGEPDLNRVPHELGVQATADGNRKRLSSTQMNLPGMALPNPPPVANPRFTFDQFVVGPCNRFAYKAARAVANENRNAYNPLYVYGGSGLGKSHLSGAIGIHIYATQPATRILYTTAEEFVNELVYTIRKNQMREFKEKYRKRCDILFIDGVHFFSGKETTQTELSHTFDHLYNSGKRIILTGTVPPHELSHMTDGLKSRLGGGLVVDIQPPDLETRRRILRHRAEFDGVAVSEDVVDFLASRISGNVRRLEGLLINLIAKSSLLFRPIDLELAQEVIGSLQVTENQRVTISKIQKLVTRQYHLELEQLISRSRRKSVCYPRQLAMYLCRKFTDESLDAIGRAYCRDHASVIHSIGVIERQMRDKARVRREVEFLVEKLGLQKEGRG
jgi:chromosomal replication initiator protein